MVNLAENTLKCVKISIGESIKRIDAGLNFVICQAISGRLITIGEHKLEPQNGGEESARLNFSSRNNIIKLVCSSNFVLILSDKPHKVEPTPDV